MSGQKFHILIVEDEPGVRNSLQMLISSLDHKVSLATNGQEGLQELEADPSINLLITDITMPKMNGHELIRAIRSHHDARIRTLAIIAMSGRSFEEAVALAAGANTFLEKPFGPTAFEDAITKLLPQKSPTAA